MKTEKLKQNVKGYVQQFEDGGLRLLRKGQKGVIHAIFSRFWLVLVLAVIGCTSLPKRLWSRWEGGMAPAASDALRTAWMVLVLLVSVAFLVGDSYNPFLYFRF